jgi:hypothetical protein
VRARLLAAVPALALAVAACAAAAPSPRAVPVPGTSGPRTGTSGPAVGVALYGARAIPAASAAADGARLAAYARDVLAVKAVQVTWNLWQPDARSAAIGPSPITLTPADVQAVTQAAQAQGLSVEYRVLIRIGDWKWGGFAAPRNPAAWFANLYAAELPYLRIAARLHVREFIVGTELAAVNTSPVWDSFLARTGSAYPGIVSYAWLGGQILSQWQRHLLPLGEYGMTAYPDLRLPVTATVGQLAAAWTAFLGQAPGWLLTDTSVDEIGIPAIAGAYERPWDWGGLSGPLNEAVQANWFTAACEAVTRLHMRGIYFWNINLDQDPANPLFPDPVHFIGKAGAAAIRACAEGRD